MPLCRMNSASFSSAIASVVIATPAATCTVTSTAVTQWNSRAPVP